MNLDDNTVLIPGIQYKVAITVVDLQEGIRIHIEFLADGFLLGVFSLEVIGQASRGYPDGDKGQ